MSCIKYYYFLEGVTIINSYIRPDLTILECDVLLIKIKLILSLILTAYVPAVLYEIVRQY